MYAIAMYIKRHGKHQAAYGWRQKKHQRQHRIQRHQRRRNKRHTGVHLFALHFDVVKQIVIDGIGGGENI